MGLRVNTNVPAITALRTLRGADLAQRRSLERLSTGLRINRAADDPSGLVISEQLRSQIRSMQQALENSQNASNMIGTTEAALTEVSSLLIGIKESIVFAMNTGGNDADQIAAEQDAIDNALGSIDRIAQTTRFGTRKLLDGSSALSLASNAPEIMDVNVQNAMFDSTTSLQFTVNVATPASQATLLSAGIAWTGDQASNAVIRLTGSEGTQDIAISSALADADAFDDTINAYTADTGVYSSAGSLYSVDYGSRQTISLEVISGSLEDAGLSAGNGIQIDSGVDVVGNVNGISIDADGFDLRVVSDALTADIRLDSSVASGATATFTVNNDGLVFQLNQTDAASDREQIGLRSIHTALLGYDARTVPGIGGSANPVTIGGFLSTLLSGGANDLNTSPKNALRIVDDAINQVTDLRAYVGAFQANTIDTNIRSLGVALENLTASESSIRDLDFAAETADFTRSQILFQSGIAVLAQSNLISQSVLTLLG